MTKEEEIQRLKAENAMYKKELDAHGIKVRKVDIDKNDMVKLFGFKPVQGAIKGTTDYRQLRVNYNTFVANLLRAIFPYPRGNKKFWIGYKPFKQMTDAEFEESEKLIKAVIQLCLETKARIGKEVSNDE